MKIEIELKDIEELNERNSKLEAENYKLESALNKLNEDYINDLTAENAKTLFSKYLKALFEKLGFKDDREWFEVRENAMASFPQHFYGSKGKDWDEIREYEITEIGAVITDKMRRAFLKIGIKTTSKK